MMRAIAAIGATGVVFLILDAIWLTVVGGRLYRPILGDLLAPSVNWPAAVAFYLIYLGGIGFFAVWPALDQGQWTRAALNGAVLGLVAYATYDLTNQATLRTWSTTITLADIAWGTFVTCAAATAGYFAGRMVGR
ncbi:DUF2177 family protein [Brevundimonas sp. VNH65]|uniref:DUF2177 family protein n=1 Tax=Brevundimonas sp. VNH65 TaxID=3400917 RepID=UPI003C0E4015